MDSENSSDEIPGTPPRKVCKLIGGLSGSRKLKTVKPFQHQDTQNTTRNSLLICDTPSSKVVTPVTSHQTPTTSSPGSKLVGNNKVSEKGENRSEDTSSEGTSSEELSPLRPMYSGSPQILGQAQDPVELGYWSFLSSSDDSSLDSPTSVVLISFLGSASSQSDSQKEQ